MYTVCLVTQSPSVSITETALKTNTLILFKPQKASPNVDVSENTAFLSQLNPVC